MHISRVRPSESPEKYEGGQNRRAHAAGRCDMQEDIGFSFPLWPGVAGTAGSDGPSHAACPSCQRSERQVLGGDLKRSEIRVLLATSRLVRKPRLHSITLSARASNIGEMSRPSALAALRLMTRSNLVGCSTGSSLGFAPLRIRST
jgi:hypothetical protein